MSDASCVFLSPQILHDVPMILPNITDTEAENLGIFLLDVFRILERWRASQQASQSSASRCTTAWRFIAAIKIGGPLRLSRCEAWCPHQFWVCCGYQDVNTCVVKVYTQEKADTAPPRGALVIARPLAHRTNRA